MKKIISLVLCFVMVLSLLAGCGGSSEPAASEKAPAEAVPEATVANPGVSDTGAMAAGTTGATYTPVVESDSYKERVVIGTNLQCRTIDPQAESDMAHDDVFRMSHNRLTYYNSQTREVEPELATSWEWVSDTELVFKLREDVTFQNGNKFDAEDVIFTFERSRSSAVCSSKLVFLESFEALDAYTVKMTLTQHYTDWLILLSNCVFCILDKETCEADPTMGPGVGTGAWIIEEMSPNTYVELDRNDNYWGELPVTKEVCFTYIAEDSARLIALQNGEIDVCIDPANTELSYITDDPNLELVRFQSTTSTFFCFNTSKAPGNNVNIRRAIAHAINVDEVIMAATEGNATKCIPFWGWATYGYDETMEPYEYNIEKAKQYMADAGYPDGGVTIEVMVSNAERKTALQVIQSQLQEIGVDIVIYECDHSTIIGRTVFAEPMHEAMLFYTSWNYEGDDGRRMLYAGSNVNKAIYTNQEVMDLIDAAAVLPDGDERAAIYKEVQAIIHDEAPWIPLYYAVKSVGINKNCGGIIWEPHQRHEFTNICVAQ